MFFSGVGREKKTALKRNIYSITSLQINANVGLCLLNVKMGKCLLTKSPYQRRTVIINVVFSFFCCRHVAKKNIAPFNVCPALLP